MGNEKSILGAHSGEKQYINHIRFQNVNIITQNDEKFIKIQIPLHTEREFQIWINNVKLIQKFDSERLLSSKHHQFVKQGFCSSGGILTLLYQNYPYILRDEITNRKSMEKKFEECQLWYLLFTIIAVAKDFSSIDTKVGDIRSDNIFINQDGQVKLAHIYSWPGEQTNYFKKLINQQKTFLSPEEMIEIDTNVQSSESNKILSQSFSIGITLLEAGLLDDLRPIYSKTKFQSQLFNKYLIRWHDSEYSPLLKEIVSDLCQFDFNKRKKSTEIYQYLLPHEEDIKNLKSFTTNTKQTEIPQNTKIVQNQYQQLVKSQLIPEFAYVNPNQISSRNQYSNVKPLIQQTVVVPQQPVQFYQRVNYPNQPIITYGAPISQSPNIVTYSNQQTYHQSYTIPTGNNLFPSNTVMNTLPAAINKIPYYQPNTTIYQNQNLKPIELSTKIPQNKTLLNPNETLSKIDEQIMLSKQRFP